MGNRTGTNVMRTEVDEFAGLQAIGVHCENCGRRKRLGHRDVVSFSRDGVGTIERLGRRLVCTECTSRGQGNRNISVIPYLRSEAPTSK